MVRVTPFLLVLSLALVAPGFSAKKCPLEGLWQNTQGHVLKIWSVNDPKCPCDGVYMEGSRQYELKERWLYMKDNTIFGFTIYLSSDSRVVFECLYRDEGFRKILQTSWRKEHRVFDHIWQIIRRGTDTFTRVSRCPASGIAGDFNTDGSTWDAEPFSCTNVGQCSQEMGGSAEDFKADGNAWDANPFSGCSATCF